MELNQDILSLINRRENQILVHACLYYEYNKSIISDDMYDKLSFELKDLIDKYPNDFKKSQQYDGFRNFDPSSGFYLNYISKKDRAVCVYNDYCRQHNLKDFIKQESVEEHINRIKKHK